jgi:hypothetical protein
VRKKKLKKGRLGSCAARGGIRANEGFPRPLESEGTILKGNGGESRFGSRESQIPSIYNRFGLVVAANAAIWFHEFARLSGNGSEFKVVVSFYTTELLKL